MKEKKSLDVSTVDFERTHRNVAPPKQSGKVRPVIVKFVWYNDRRKIYINKKLLRGTEVSITENLTAHRVAKVKRAKEKFGFKNVWSLIFEGVSGHPATPMMVLFPTLVNNVLLITNVARS